MRIRIIDAFTDRPFAGNPAAVCLLDTATWPDEGSIRHPTPPTAPALYGICSRSSPTRQLSGL